MNLTSSALSNDLIRTLPIFTKGELLRFQENQTLLEVLEILNNLQASPLSRTKFSASVVGRKWFIFSEFMPELLCQLASKMSSNQSRRRILEIAWEELGGVKSNSIHSELFLDCLSIANVTPDSTSSNSDAIHFLKNLAIQADRSDCYIFGICLGLEIVALENIEAIFHSLAHNQTIEERLVESDFFKIHRKNEIHHIVHNIDNINLFCNLDREKLQFSHGLNNSLVFWKMFWSEVLEEIHFISN